MYGSQFHFEQTLAAKKFTATETQYCIMPAQIKIPSWMKILAILITMTISSTTFASPSIPKISNPKILANFIR